VTAIVNIGESSADERAEYVDPPLALLPLRTPTGTFMQLTNVAVKIGIAVCAMTPAIVGVSVTLTSTTDASGGGAADRAIQRDQMIGRVRGLTESR